MLNFVSSIDLNVCIWFMHRLLNVCLLVVMCHWLCCLFGVFCYLWLGLVVWLGFGLLFTFWFKCL